MIFYPLFFLAVYALQPDVFFQLVHRLLGCLPAWLVGPRSQICYSTTLSGFFALAWIKIRNLLCFKHSISSSSSSNREPEYKTNRRRENRNRCPQGGTVRKIHVTAIYAYISAARQLKAYEKLAKPVGPSAHLYR